MTIPVVAFSGGLLERRERDGSELLSPGEFEYVYEIRACMLDCIIELVFASFSLAASLPKTCSLTLQGIQSTHTTTISI